MMRGFRLRIHNDRIVRAVGTAVVLAALSCDPLAPFQPEIGNTADSFQFQVTDMRNVTLTRDYEWQHTGSVANVNQATTISAGSAILTVRDAAGSQVFRRDLTENGTFQTGAGTAGKWNIRVEFSRATGTVNFRVQRQ